MTTEQIESVDHYEVLQVEASATTAEIKSSYLRLVREFTPESSPAHFRVISAAYKTLSNPEKRRAYDSEERLPEELRERMAQLMREAIEDESESALDGLRQIAHEHSESKSIRFALGVTLDRTSNHPEAAQVFGEIFEEDPTNAEIATWLGDALLSAGHEERGVQILKEAIVLDKDCTIAYLCLARHYSDNDDHASAMRILERGVHADGVVDIQDLPLFIEQILILARSSDWEKLEAVAKTLCAVVPQGDAEARQYAASQLAPLAEVFIQADRADLTHFVFETMRQLDPHNNEIADFANKIKDNALGQRHRPLLYEDALVAEWVKAVVALWSGDLVPDDPDQTAAALVDRINGNQKSDSEWKHARSKHLAAMKPFDAHWREFLQAATEVASHKQTATSQSGCLIFLLATGTLALIT